MTNEFQALRPTCGHPSDGQKCTNASDKRSPLGHCTWHRAFSLTTYREHLAQRPWRTAGVK